jgi:tetratricopeptide (TPR) repeat protein
LALDAVQRALELSPDLPQAHFALGDYYYRGFLDYERALQEYTIAEQGMPGASELYVARAFVYRRLGHWDQSLASMEQAIQLDPRNSVPLRQQAVTYTAMHDYAKAERYYERAFELAPGNWRPYVSRAWVHIYRDGDPTLMKETAENPPMDIGSSDKQEMGWTAAIYERDYDTALNYLENPDPDVIQDIIYYAPKASLRGLTHQLAGQPELAAQEFRAARSQLEETIETSHQDARVFIALGEALAGLGEYDAAVRAAYQAMKMLPTSRDAINGAAIQIHAIVRVFIPSGAHEEAIARLDAYLASQGGWWSIEGLLPDPRLDPIRDDPNFQAVVKKHTRQ